MSQLTSGRVGSSESLQSLCSLSTVESRPEGIPQKLDGPMVWKGASIQLDQYVTKLSNEDVASIRGAVVNFRRECYYISLTKVTAADS